MVAADEQPGTQIDSQAGTPSRPAAPEPPHPHAITRLVLSWPESSTPTASDAACDRRPDDAFRKIIFRGLTFHGIEHDRLT
jgi:hypothetical protein